MEVARAEISEHYMHKSSPDFYWSSIRQGNVILISKL